jgi:hypothetical protein
MPHPQGSASDFESVHDDGAWLEYIPLSRPFPHELLLKFSSTGVNLGLEDSARLAWLYPVVCLTSSRNWRR